MKPKQTGEHYDRIATWWREQHNTSSYGVDQLNRAVSFVADQAERCALDVGCGSSGRFMRVLVELGFEVDGMDISEEMICQAHEILPDSTYYCEDIATWVPTRKYDLVVAWDSTFHLPLSLQEPALKNMCSALGEGGIVMFTFGALDAPGEISGGFQGEDFEYSSLGIQANLELLHKLGCSIRHFEFDQGAQEPHAYVIAQKSADASDALPEST